jgi:PAS domain S-box-containing protein
MSGPAVPLILNVDDDPTARRARTLVLEDAGLAVVEAENGRTALRRVEEQRPDLVLLDVRLPDIDGIEVCRRIKQAHPTLPVLQTSAVFTEPEARARGIAGGADKYLAQPFEPEELIACVRVLLRLKRAEAAARESEARLAVTFDHAPVGIAEGGLDGRILRVNERFCELAGRPREALLGLAFRDLVDADDTAAEARELRRLLAGEAPFCRLEQRYRRPDGSAAWVAATCSLVRDGEGRPLYAVRIVEDIGAARRAAEALRRSEERFRAIVESATDFAIFTFDRAGLATSWNTGAERLFGHAAADMLGRDVRVIFTPEDVAAGALEQAMNRALETGRGTDERWQLRADGSRFWAAGIIMPLREGGGIAGFLKILRDRTDERAAEERFRATFEQAAVGMAHVGLDGRWLRVNDRLCEITLYPREELLGLTVADITHPEDVAADAAQRRALASGEIATGSREKRYVRKDGTIAWVSVTVSTLRDASGRPERFSAVIVDVTERRRAEAELVRLNRELERRVDERTQALMESEAARRRAEHMELLGQMTGSVAHDINNVLTVVLGNLAVLESRLGPDQARLQRLVESAQKAAEKGERMAQDLLAFARKQRLEPVALDVNAVVAGMDDILRSLLPEEIVLRLQLAGGLPPAYADQNQLERAILNLVSNARDAMTGHAGAITVETGIAEPEPDLAERQLRLTVRDEGPGMPDEVREHAFEPFFTTKPAGTGLGLSQVYGFARQSQGRVAIDRSDGAGTAVTITLPRAATESAPPSVES